MRNLMSVNKKTTATNGGSFAGIQSYQLFFPKVTGYTRPQIPNCSFSVAAVRPILQDLSVSLSYSPVTNGCCQWRFVVSFRLGIKSIVTGKGAAVGLNGGVVHTVHPGANCLPGTECRAWNERTAAITAE